MRGQGDKGTRGQGDEGTTGEGEGAGMVHGAWEGSEGAPVCLSPPELRAHLGDEEKLVLGPGRRVQLNLRGVSSLEVGEEQCSLSRGPTHLDGQGVMGCWAWM